MTIPTPAAPTRALHGADAPDDATWQVNTCDTARLGLGTDFHFRWFPPGVPVPPSGPPPTSALAQLLLLEVTAQMEAPQVASDPPLDAPSIVNTPVFVEVTNWQPEINPSRCYGGTCISMTATPTLAYDPGDGSGPITCTPPGSRYDPAGPSLDQQAEGACAHTYTRRTGVDSRPTAWPAQVTITWNVSWTSNDPAQPGDTFAPVVLSTPVPRPVHEVQAVVVDAS